MRMKSIGQFTAASALILALTVLFAASAESVLRPAPAFAQEQKSDNPLSGDAEAIEKGLHLFRGGTVCAQCHGMNANGGGRGAPNAANLQKFKRGFSAFMKTVKEGYKTMPAWGGGRALSDEEILQIGAWLETLAKPEANWKDPQQ